ncbi:MAG: hypothetical protein LBU45_00110, partial [Azoarcus sp.]|nr:hypothetical protein [Azoarcus sp.]
MIRINELRLPLDHPPEALPNAAAKRLSLPVTAIRQLSVAKRSHDARKRNAPSFIYSVDVEVADEAGLLKKFADDTHIGPTPDTTYRFVARASMRPDSHPDRRPVIIGFGPAGI